MTDWIRDASVLSSHLADESGLVGVAEAILFPRSPEEARMAIAAAAAEHRHVTIQGGKTGFCGGAVPDAGVVVNLSRLNAVTAFHYDEAERTGRVTVRAGCTLEQIDAGLARKNFDPANWDLASQAAWEKYIRSPGALWFLPNPTETTATIGGVAATGASGSRVPGGGVPQHIAAMTAIRADGRLARLDANACAIDRLCGSEGIVGVIADVTILLTPRPDALYGLMSFHDSYDQAEAFLRSVKLAASREEEAEIIAADWFDASCREFLNTHATLSPRTVRAPDFPSGAAAALWLEFSGAEEGRFSLLSVVMNLLENGGGNADAALAATDDREWKQLGHFRHMVNETGNRPASGSPSPVFDWTAPADKWATIAGQTTAILRRDGIPFTLMGHALDGRMSARLPGLSTSSREARSIAETMAEHLRRAGCVASGEHGYGRLKRDWFMELSPKEAERWRRFRATADPLGLLNRCVMT